MTRHMTHAEYVARDYRVKCNRCRRWMRYSGPTASTPATRAPVPNASHCTDCLRPLALPGVP